MSFNQDVSTQVQEVISSKKIHELSHPSTLFDNIPVQHTSTKKHLVVYLNEKLNFNTHIRERIGKYNKGIGVITKLYRSLLQDALLFLNFFIKSLLDYCDILYD